MTKNEGNQILKDDFLKIECCLCLFYSYIVVVHVNTVYAIYVLWRYKHPSGGRDSNTWPPYWGQGHFYVTIICH